jgi:hypothetical protein
MVSSPLNRDFLGRSIVTIVESGDMVDYLGRDISAGALPDPGDETDYLGRALLPPAGPT